MNKAVGALMAAVLVMAGLAGGIYMGPMRNQAAVAGWHVYTTVVTIPGRPTGSDHRAMDGVMFKDHGQYWGAKLALPASWPKGAQFTLWVRWQPPATSLRNPAMFRVSSVVWPMIGLVLGWILGMSLICLTSRPRRKPRQVPVQHIHQRTGAV